MCSISLKSIIFFSFLAASTASIYSDASVISILRGAPLAESSRRYSSTLIEHSLSRSFLNESRYFVLEFLTSSFISGSTPLPRFLLRSVNCILAAVSIHCDIFSVLSSISMPSRSDNILSMYISGPSTSLHLSRSPLNFSRLP